MYKKFTILYFSITAVTCFAIILKINPLIIFGHGFVMSSLGVYYWINKNTEVNKVDKYIYLICVISTIGDTSTFWGINQEFELIYQILSTLMVNIIYMAIFRLEGAYFNPTKKKHVYWSILILFLMLIYGIFFILDLLNNDFYIVISIYIFFETSQVLLAFFRQVSKISYHLVILGLCIKILCDWTYGFYYFKQLNVYIYLIVYFTYSFSQYFVIVGVLSNSNNGLIDSKT